jgi:hypothetical protein
MFASVRTCLLFRRQSCEHWPVLAGLDRAGQIADSRFFDLHLDPLVDFNT